MTDSIHQQEIDTDDNITSENMKIVFAPGCFDDFDGTQEELDEFVKLLQTGEFLKDAITINIDDMDDDQFANIVSQLPEKYTTRN